MKLLLVGQIIGVAFLTLIIFTVNSYDRSLSANETGFSLVLATIDRISQTNILNYNKYFIYALGLAMSGGGNAYLKGTGGLFQVSEMMLNRVVRKCKRPNGVRDYICVMAIKDFKIDFRDATIERLDVPLLSGLTLAIYHKITQQTSQIDKMKAKEYIDKHIKRPNITARTLYYMEDEIQEKMILDLVIIYQCPVSKQMLQNIVKSLVISKHFTRLALMTFDTDGGVTLKYGFTTNNELSIIISNDEFCNTNGTNPSAFIEDAHKYLNSSGRLEAAKVILTIFQSEIDRTVVRKFAKKARKDNIYITGIGIGDDADIHIIKKIAAKPSLSHVVHLHHIDDFIPAQMFSIYQAPLIVTSNITLTDLRVTNGTYNIQFGNKDSKIYANKVNIEVSFYCASGVIVASRDMLPSLDYYEHISNDAMCYKQVNFKTNGKEIAYASIIQMASDTCNTDPTFNVSITLY